MRQLIKSFPDGSFLEYDQGNFDGWCVYFTKKGESRRAPSDTDYFRQLRRLSKQYGVERIYNDFVRVYDLTGERMRNSDLIRISQIAAAYGSGALEVDVVLSTLYAVMAAEEQKRFTRLGKRIKRLGIYRLLIENCGVDEAANFMRGMGWRDIARLCEARGF